MSNYRDEIVAAMTAIGREPDTAFIGYNVRHGGKAGGSLNDVPEEKLIEMPLAENLMAGAAIGLSLDGLVPVLWFERADFLFCAMDAIVNHLNHIAALSEGQHKPAVIIRVCVGNKSAPLFTGPTHTQDPTEAIKKLVGFNVIQLTFTETIATHYGYALAAARDGHSTMLVEYKDRYAQE